MDRVAVVVIGKLWDEKYIEINLSFEALRGRKMGKKSIWALLIHN